MACEKSPCCRLSRTIRPYQSTLKGLSSVNYNAGSFIGSLVNLPTGYFKEGSAASRSPRHPTASTPVEKTDLSKRGESKRITASYCCLRRRHVYLKSSRHFRNIANRDKGFKRNDQCDERFKHCLYNEHTQGNL